MASVEGNRMNNLMRRTLLGVASIGLLAGCGATPLSPGHPASSEGTAVIPATSSPAPSASSPAAASPAANERLLRMG